MSILSVRIYDWNVVEPHHNLIAYLFGMNIVGDNALTGTVPIEIVVHPRFTARTFSK